eukprot:scaffold25867_cov55-Attheya_sp.AAC.1
MEADTHTVLESLIDLNCLMCSNGCNIDTVFRESCAKEQDEPPTLVEDVTRSRSRSRDEDESRGEKYYKALCGIHPLSGIAGTYAVAHRPGLSVLPYDPNHFAGQQIFPPPFRKKQPYSIKRGDKVAVVDIKNGVAKLAAGNGFIIIKDESQLVKIGVPQGKSNEIEGNLCCVYTKTRELRGSLDELVRLEANLSRDLHYSELTDGQQYYIRSMLRSLAQKGSQITENLDGVARLVTKYSGQHEAALQEEFPRPFLHMTRPHDALYDFRSSDISEVIDSITGQDTHQTDGTCSISILPPPEIVRLADSHEPERVEPKEHQRSTQKADDATEQKSLEGFPQEEGLTPPRAVTYRKEPSSTAGGVNFRNGWSVQPRASARQRTQVLKYDQRWISSHLFLVPKARRPKTKGA